MRENTANKIKSLGYTLIELLLVIAIISIIAALGILAYRRSFFTQRVEKVSLEMQHVLEAAMAFNVDHQGSWPGANNATPNCIPADPNDTFVKDYLPQGRRDNVTTSFGNHYCWSAVQNGTRVGSLPTTTAQLFWVAVPIPNGDRPLAQRIAARLPNTIVTSDPNSKASPAPPCSVSGGECYVRSEITRPSQASNEQSGMHVAAIGMCRSNALGPIKNNGGGNCSNGLGGASAAQNDFRVTFNACPIGSPEINATPDYYNVPLQAFGANILRVYTTQSNCVSQAMDGIEHCDVGVRVMVCSGSTGGKHPHCARVSDILSIGGSEGLSYIVSCVPNNLH